MRDPRVVRPLCGGLVPSHRSCFPHRGELSGTRGFTLIELLVVIAIISIIAGLIVPTLVQGRRRAHTVQCASNIKQLYVFASDFADVVGSNRFPFERNTQGARAHDHLNLLVEYAGDSFPAELFVCPASDATAAETAEDGSYLLDAETLAFAWVGRPLKNTSANKVLLSDKYVEDCEDDEGVHEGHRDGMNVLRTDGSVRFVRAADLPQDRLLPKGLVR